MGRPFLFCRESRNSLQMIAFSPERRFGRGLTYQEVAIIKRMRLMEHPRDYIFSFILRPGRKLTPAAIAEVEAGKIGPEVEPATEREVEVFLSQRLAEAGGDTAEYGPLSSFQIAQSIGWFTRAQGDLLRDETQQVEFKLIMKSQLEDLIGYAKTMAAFANNTGGYIFFGVSDSRKPVGINEAEFNSFDWDRLAAICREYFQPDVLWDRGVYKWEEKTLGVVYVYEAKQKPVVAAREAKALSRGAVYFRYRGHTEYIGLGDFFQMLQARDERVRAETQAQLAPFLTSVPNRGGLNTG